MDYEIVKLNERVSNMLLQMGASPDLLGFRYLKDGVMIALKKHGKIKSIIKDLYGKIAECNDSTAQSVERTIRHTIEIIWNKGRIDVINKCFGVTIFNKIEKPTNGQFLMILAEKVSREFYFNEDGKLIKIENRF